jgi:hypothetical protein
MRAPFQAIRKYLVILKSRLPDFRCLDFGDWRARLFSHLFRNSLPGTRKYGCLFIVKTTLEIPDPLFRRAKATAAHRGQTLRQFVTEAMREKLEARKPAGSQPWMQFFGACKGQSAEFRKIDRVIAEEFGRIDHEDWK